MGTWNKIDGVWREQWSGNAKINGVWRDVNSWIKVNGVWRQTSKHDIEESDIIGFKMVYKFMNQAYHPDFPQLKVNPDLPVIVKLTGEYIGELDDTRKGIVFEYTREEYEKEGIMVYRGDLYAILNNQQLVNVGMAISDAASDKRIPSNIPGITEYWSTNRLAKLSITINADVIYESNGYYMAGWNSLFSKEQFIDLSNYPDKTPYKNKLPMNSYDILPIYNREDSFNSAAYIGIARDMTSENTNMIGSYGLLDHSISAIKVNGIVKPFVVELYN